jgi:myo-inositol-1(or 4)-monophosphatase
LPAADFRADTARFRALMASAVREAGALALNAFRGEQKIWMKSGNSPVSEADLAVDALLRDRLVSATPDFGWLSEESVDDPARLAAPAIWVVDPIDGTRGYLAGQPDWTISVALVAEGRPIVAALYAPATDELFIATVGEGASRNGVAIVATGGAGLAGARIAAPHRRLHQLAAIDENIVAEPKVHSLALRIARVAQGALDVAFAGGNSHDWDLAAADLLVHEAGGALTTLGGQAVIYNRPAPVHNALVAAGRIRHAALLEVIRARPADFA